MIIKKILLTLAILHFTLFASEVVWDGKASEKLKKEYSKVIKQYVDKKYPEKVERWKRRLMWQDDEDVIDIQRDWKGAKEYCQSLSLLGYDDWFLPTKAQLKSLHLEMPYLKNISTSRYWSSSVYISYAMDVWDIYFQDSSESGEYFVRCAREIKH